MVCFPAGNHLIRIEVRSIEYVLYLLYIRWKREVQVGGRVIIPEDWCEDTRVRPCNYQLCTVFPLDGRVRRVPLFPRPVSRCQLSIHALTLRRVDVGYHSISLDILPAAMTSTLNSSIFISLSQRYFPPPLTHHHQHGSHHREPIAIPPYPPIPTPRSNESRSQ